MKILGGLDILGALILILVGAGIAPGKTFLIVFGAIFILKSLIGFLQDVGSWIDISCGIFLLISILIHIPSFVAFILAFVLAQKGIFSFM
ncbi:MAG: hypothetical protein AABX30_01680 [Nanoarchaeota archaeon]